ncbi:FXSXX-COOH protein [Asanoa hainanensis]|uniref:FXSXX-COOH protein n=1 Tax=Asanoa hainanensis TaxID=560556 RepID=A0A239P8P8_9ACTN|nr:FxSxx-COOH cyclophane-containing RiPP peptide [Asanoa hainanensis]SNT62779.1 FXSXX-COOH protein [Asanoa hainanensis]
MTLAGSQQTPDPVRQPGLVDVTDVQLADLLGAEESAFAETFRRFVAEATDQNRSVFAAFQSALGE